MLNGKSQLNNLSTKPPHQEHLVILHINDTHSQLAPRTVKGRSIGGIARLAGLIKQIRQENPDRVLLLQGGDVFSIAKAAVTSYYGGAANFHDNNHITFHRIEDFRSDYGPTFCGDPGTVYLAADLDADCYVNWGDFSVFASYWLQDNCQAPDFCGGADMDQSSLVDWGDFSMFASQWLWCSDPAEPNCDQYW